MVLLIDTTEDKKGKDIALLLGKYGNKTVILDITGDSNRMSDSLRMKNSEDVVEYVDTEDMNISHCLGCNYCWLKTPGKCVINDDYEPLLKKISRADQVWLISDTKFGFVSYKTKNIMDRLMPIVTMNLHYVGDQMRHIARYEHNPDWGLIYTGEGDKENLSLWCERVAVNFSRKSLGAFAYDKCGEAIGCMQ